MNDVIRTIGEYWYNTPAMNLADKMEGCLPRQLLELLEGIRGQAAGRGERAYLVGGVVRDMLLGYTSFDLDVVVEGSAVDLARQVAATGQAQLLAHHRFGTAKLRYADMAVDLTTARRETYARPGALPAVTPGTLKDDLFRRDFSINAMAMSLSSDDYGKLIDPYGGKGDIESSLIRILHAQSFVDDATRILRAVRYEQRLGFELEAQTSKLLQRDVAMLDTISGDRIRHELELVFREDRPESAIARLAGLGVLEVIGCSLTGDGWIADKFDRARAITKAGRLPPLYFCLLSYKLTPAETGELIGRLNMPAGLSGAMHDTVLLRDTLRELDDPSLKPSAVYYLLREYDLLAVQANAIAADSPAVSRHLQLFLTKLRHVKTSLSGEDLKALGFSAGPEMGQVLRALHKARLDGEVNTKADERKLALSLKRVHIDSDPAPEQQK